MLFGELGQLGDGLETIYKKENNFNWLSYTMDTMLGSAHTIKVQTNEPARFTNEWKTYYVKARLDDYYRDYPYTTRFD